MSARNGVNYACLLVAKPLLQRRPSPPPASGVVGAGNVGTSDRGPGPSGSCCGLRCGCLQAALQLCTADVLRTYSVRVELCCSILLGIIPYTVHTLSGSKRWSSRCGHSAFRSPGHPSSADAECFSRMLLSAALLADQSREERDVLGPPSLSTPLQIASLRACSVH